MNTYHKLISLVFLGVIFFRCKSINDGVASDFNEDACPVKDRKELKDNKKYKVNFFMETSGSMNGFMSKNGTEFQKDVHALVNQLEGGDPSGRRRFHPSEFMEL